jgi:hypothetical protein
MEAQVLTAVLAFGSAVGLFFIGKHLEHRSVNKAILAEIDRLIEVIAGHELWWANCIDQGTHEHRPLVPFSTDIYDKLAPNIGAVDGAHVAQVARFFGYVKFLNSLQTQQKTQPSQTHALAFAQIYLGSLRNCLRDYDGAFDSAFMRYGIGGDDGRYTAS